MNESARRIAFAVGLLAVGCIAIGGMAGTGAAQGACTQPAEFPVQMTDATGTTVTVNASPETVVALQASDARTMHAIDEWGRVDGYPVGPATADLPTGDRVDIADNYTTDVERVVNLEPDLVLAGNVTPTSTVTQLRSAGLTVYQFRIATSIEDIKTVTTKTGALVGECEGATASVEWMTDSIEAITANISNDLPLTYYAQGGGWTAGPGTFQHDLIDTAGLENLAGRTDKSGWFQMSDEFVLNENPPWLMFSDGLSEPPVSDNLNFTTAVQEKQYIRVDANNVSQPTPHVVYAIETMAQAVFPGAGSAENPDAYPQPPEPTHGCSYPRTLTDASGTTVALNESPETIVALQASDARTLYEIGAWDRVVGYPMTPATASLPAGERVDISNGYATDIEAVVDLAPDIVLSANVTTTADNTALRNAGLTVYHFPIATDLEDIVDMTETAGRLAGACNGADETARWMEQRIANVTAAVDESRKPLGYYAQGGGWTAGPETFQHDVLETAGLENVAARTGQSGWVQLSAEFIIEQNPDWIVYADTADEPPIAASVEYTTAAQQENFVTIDPNNMSQPAPTIIYPLERIAEVIDPTVSVGEGGSTFPGSRPRSSPRQPAEPATETYTASELATSCPDPTYPIEFTDVTGHESTLAERPETIVALQASDARILHSIGAWDRVVGYPVSPATADLPAGDRVNTAEGTGDASGKIVDLDPDVVIAGNETETDVIEQLRSVGLPVYSLSPAHSLGDIESNTRQIGTVVDACPRASDTVRWMGDRLEAIRTEAPDDRPLAYYATGDGVTAGPGTIQHEVLTAAGLENVAARTNERGWFEISTEFVLEQDPAYIVYSNEFETPPIPESLASTRAGQADRFITVEPTNLSQPAPTVVYAAEEIAESVEPVGFGEDNETTTMDPADDTSGFGASIALVAVVASLLAARWRST